jgi:hypothetical protein
LSDLDGLGASTLWLPCRSRREAWAATAVVLCVYLATMSRDLSFYDSAELALVAQNLGLGHPLGQPLHTLCGFVVSHLPLVPPLVGLNALSAVAAALCMLPAVSLAESLHAPARTRERAVLATAVAAFFVHPVAWENATRVEVYALGALPALWCVARLTPELCAPSPRPRAVLACGVSLGLSACSNAHIAAFTTLALLPLAVGALVTRRIGPRHVVAAVGGAAAGLAPFLYVPAVAARTKVFVWGNPTGGWALRHYFSGADYAANVVATPAEWGRHVLQWIGWAAANGVLPLMAVGMLGHAVLCRSTKTGRARAATAPFATLMTVLLLAANADAVFFPEIPDYAGYLFPPFVVCGAGVAAILAAIAGRRGRIRAFGLFSAALLVAGAAAAPPGLTRSRRAADRVARVFAQGVLDEAPRDAIVLAESDYWVFPLHYLQESEGLRPDVAILAVGLASSTWYWDHLYALHPGIKRVAPRGPGGREGRIRRFLRANPDRAVLFEHSQLASLVTEPVCAGAWMSHAHACGRDRRHAISATSRRLAKALDTVGEGSPPSDAVLAAVALTRGEALWRLGDSKRALEALLAGVPSEWRPRHHPHGSGSVPPLRGPLPVWSRAVPIGDAARNLWVAAGLLHAMGDTAGARDCLRGAAALGLPETAAASMTGRSDE